MRNAEKQPETVRFVTGIDQSGGTRGAEPGTFELIKNMRFQSGGLQKRCGSSAVTGEADGVSIYNAPADTASVPRPTERPAFIGRVGDQKISATSAGDAFVYGGTKWTFGGSVSAAQPVRKRLGASPRLPTQPCGPYMPACAVMSDGYLCTAAVFAGDLRISIEAPAGDQIFTRLFGTVGPDIVVRVVVVGSTFYVLFQLTGGTAITALTITVTNGVVSGGASTATAATLTNAASTWDASSYDGTNWFIVYQSAATTVTLAKMAGTAASATATFSTTDNLTYLSVWDDSVTDRVWVGLVDAPTSAGSETTAFRVYTDTPTLSLGPTTLVTALNSGPPLFGPFYTRTPAAGDAFVCYVVQTAALGASSPFALYATGIVGGTALFTPAAQAFNVVPISKPDAQHRVWCMTFAPGSNFALSQVVLLRIGAVHATSFGVGNARPIVELASPKMESPGATFHPSAQFRTSFHAVAVTSESSGGSTFFALPFTLTSRTNASGATEPTTRCDVYQYTRYNQEPHRQFIPTGRSGVAAGQPTELWGMLGRLTPPQPLPSGCVEIGFPHGPSVLSSTVTPDANGIAAGSYNWYAIEQWVDDEGNRHISAPSAPYALTLTVPSSVLLNVTTCTLGQRTRASDPSTRLLYRTQNGGTEAQLVPIVPTDPGGGQSGYVIATDTVADTIIDDNEFLPTAGGVLANVLAPSCRYIAVSEERLWCGGLWDSNIIECSKVRVPQEPFNFTGHASHQVVIPGEVTGLAYMDGQVVAFTEDAIYLVSGDGPNDQGAGGFAPPRALVRGVGCPREQSASILETEAGILFRSAMGFYAIPRGFGTPQYIGDKVQDENPLVLSAATTTTSDNRLARFLVAASGGTSSNKVLVLDLTNMQWIRDEYTVDGAVITGQGFSEIGEWPDGLALMSYGLDRADNPNVIWAEDEDLTGDAGAAGVSATTYIAQYARTNWASIAGPVGLMRCSEVVVKMEPIGSSSAVTMAVETDRNESQSLSWTITNSNPVEYRSLVVKEQQCTEFRVTVSDAAGVSNGAGVRLLALGLEVGPIPGIRRGTDSEGG